jgi:hypothetical protein
MHKKSSHEDESFSLPTEVPKSICVFVTTQKKLTYKV